jgi:predicted dehydrogenase
VTRLRCAVAGLGRIGSLLEDDRLREKPATHAGAIHSNRDCILVGGCDPDPSRREAFARRWRCRRVFADVDSLLADSKPDVLHVASPPDTHLAIVEAAARAGVRVIVCEKPLAERLDEARRIAGLDREGGPRILTNHERRYSRDYLAARRIVAEGRYGPLLSIASRLYLGRTRPAADILLFDGTHLVDVIAFLAGAVLELRGAALARVAGAGDGEAAAAEALVVTAAAGAVPVLMEIGSGRDHLVFEVDLSFARGRLRIGNGVYEEYRSGPSPYYTGMRSLARVRRGRPRVTGYFAGMMADAVACARDSGRRPVSSAADGAAALEFVDAVLRAAGTGSLAD